MQNKKESREQSKLPDPKRRKKKASLARRVFRVSMLTGFLSTLLASALFVMWLEEIGAFQISDQKLTTIINYQSVDNTLVLDRNGEKIGELFNRYHVFVPYEKLPDAFIKALVAIEDRSFFEHKGIDLRGIMRALVDRLRGARLKQGASTITQQLVRHFLLSKDKSLERKVKEAILAIRLERLMSKERILELYSNVLFLGNGSYGVGAAAMRYFGKNVDELKAHEWALIAGLFQSPSRYNPQRHPKRAKIRQKQVIYAMYDHGSVSVKEAQAMLKAPLEYKEYESLYTKVAPYFLDYVRDEAKEIMGGTVLNQGYRIHTTLDKSLQEMARQTLKERQEIFDLADRLVLIPSEKKHLDSGIEGAVLSTDPTTGEILAMVGGRNYQKSKFNRTVQAYRQPGSAFKPVIYSLALKEGKKWSDLIYVSPVAVENYRPKNFSNQFMTEVTMLRAFFKSINTPAVEIGAELGLSKVLAHAKNLGIKTPLKIETGSMLGASDVTMMDMASMYGTIANKGVPKDLYAIAKIEDRNGKVLYERAPKTEVNEALSPQDAFLMTEGLRAVFRYGTAYSENDMYTFAAGKTGTSNQSRDNWFCGFTPNLATVVWVGSDHSFEFLGKATGTSLALPLWAHYMRKASVHRKPPPFEVPPGIVQERVHSQYGYISPVGFPMYFKRGFEPTRTSSDLKVLSEKGSYRSIFAN